jgi:hypothetical protein
MGNRNILHGSVRHTNPRTRQELQPKKHHNFIESLLTPREPVVGDAGFVFGTTRLFLGLAVDAVAILRGPLRSRGSAHFRREQRNPLFLSGVGDRLRFTIGGNCKARTTSQMELLAGARSEDVKSNSGVVSVWRCS